MAKKTEARSTLFLFLSLLLFLTLLKTTEARRRHHHRTHRGSVAVYSGPDDLTRICANGTYSYVIFGFIFVFGKGQTPLPNLATMSDPEAAGPIRYCQRKGIKLMLSIGGIHGDYSLTSKADAKNFSLYLWNNYLGGCSPNRPFGTAVLDGIDFYIEEVTTSPLHWDDLARYLRSYGSKHGKKKVYLSASPGCFYPDYFLGTALKKGLFDYVWIQYYQPFGVHPNNPSCMYLGDNNVTNLLNSWAVWTKSVKAKFFLGLVPVPRPSGTIVPPAGFIPVDVMTKQILPVVKKSRKYGGVMIWNEIQNDGYLADILPSVR